MLGKHRRILKRPILMIFCFLCVPLLFAFAGTVEAQPPPLPLENQAPLPVGTVINVQNWQKYKDYLTEGQQWLFSGKYFWKILPDQEIVVGPTTPIPLPSDYATATEQYSGQVTLKNLPDGGDIIQNYTAGVPFPHPSGPNAGVEILWNVWYRYEPFMCGSSADNPLYEMLVDRYHSVNNLSIMAVFMRLGHLSQKGMPIYPYRPFDYSEYVEELSPEEAKYTVSLILFYLDPEKVQETWAYIPSLRRALRLSGATRCAPSIGGDLDLEDQRFGYNGQTSTFEVKLVAHKRVLALVHMGIPQIPDFSDHPGQLLWDFSGGQWPPPSAGKWELRDSYVIEAQKVPSLRSGYCYGLRRLYVDSETWVSTSYDLYDMEMKPWKYIQETFGPVDIPGTNDHYIAGASGGVQMVWDIQNDHTTAIINPHPLTNSEWPPQYHNVKRYGTPEGLLDVMQ